MDVILIKHMSSSSRPRGRLCILNLEARGAEWGRRERALRGPGPGGRHPGSQANWLQMLLLMRSV